MQTASIMPAAVFITVRECPLPQNAWRYALGKDSDVADYVFYRHYSLTSILPWFFPSNRAMSASGPLAIPPSYRW